MTSKIIGFAVFAAAILAPSLAFAQTTTTGLLNVYVQVLNQTGYSYSPSNFTVAISGASPSLTTFQGSQSGTLVSLNPGAYSVTLTNQLGYSPTYSQGCNSTIAAGNTQTCVITVSAGAYNYPNVSQYPYWYNSLIAPALTCRTDTPTVALGQSARFTAIGGAGGTYNWTTGTQNYPNVGPVLTTTFPGSGNWNVTVTNASQTATCPVTVTDSYYPQPISSPVTYPTNYPTTYQNYPTTYSNYNNTYPYQIQPTVISYSNPRFPNTGFEPLNSAQMAFALVLVMGAAIAAYPYARKALALAVR